MLIDHELDRHLEILITICLVPSRVQPAHTRLLDTERKNCKSNIYKRS